MEFTFAFERKFTRLRDRGEELSLWISERLITLVRPRVNPKGSSLTRNGCVHFKI